MKRFAFRLQTLLDLAGRKLELAQRELGVALGELRQAEDDERVAARREREAGDAFLDQAASGSVTSAGLRLLQSRLGVLERATSATRSRRSEREAEWRAQHELMMDARRELLALERAREKAWESWREESEREELAQLDETAGQRHAAPREGQDQAQAARVRRRRRRMTRPGERTN